MTESTVLQQNQNLPPTEEPIEVTSPLAETGRLVHVELGSTALIPEREIQAGGAEQLTSAELTKEQKVVLAEGWLSTRGEQADSVPADIASEVSILVQKEINQLDGFVIDDEFVKLAGTRDRAIEAAEELDFELVQLSKGSWTLHAKLNAMHDKFRHVPVEALSEFLGPSDGSYELRALRLVNIIADHAPALLTENLKAIVDPTQPLWRASSAHASILLRGARSSNVDDMHIDQMPTSLPVSSRVEYVPTTDDEAMKPIANMSDEELALYCRPDVVSAVHEKGYATFNELNLPARETLLTRRLFEAAGKSNNEGMKELADKRNREFEHEPVLEQGDLVHATSSPEILESMLSHGFRCGEAILGNDRATIKYPFTVSFLEVSEKIAAPESLPERLNLLRNEAYGAINVVLHRDSSATAHTEGQDIGVVNQRQIFGGVPSTEIKSIIIRDQQATAQTVAKVTQAVVKHGMFIPVYRGATGESLLSSEQFDQLVTQAS